MTVLIKMRGNGHVQIYHCIRQRRLSAHNFAEKRIDGCWRNRPDRAGCPADTCSNEGYARAGKISGQSKERPEVLDLHALPGTVVLQTGGRPHQSRWVVSVLRSKNGVRGGHVPVGSFSTALTAFRQPTSAAVAKAQLRSAQSALRSRAPYFGQAKCRPIRRGLLPCAGFGESVALSQRGMDILACRSERGNEKALKPIFYSKVFHGRAARHRWRPVNSRRCFSAGRRRHFG